jgi:uncharacterized protein with FMN-binding domain
MMYESYGYCQQCRELVGDSTIEHARKHHDQNHKKLPRVTHVEDGHYIATYDGMGHHSMCVWIEIEDHDICAECEAVQVPHDVADPRDEDDVLWGYEDAA